ncbi:MAG: hypothetical protein CVU46_02205 [Chloroflexi bacterium HGW-Chloroflexi-8]|jgi:hypothetical protein|nr:MAG: hypothetical protein CVU46_02205 [Chloroflexi bacterium HGW-Chloroflexi-8]
MENTSIFKQKRIFLPFSTGLLGAISLITIYFGIVSWAESPAHAAEFFWQDRWIVLPIIIGFGVQAALYTILKLRLYLPVTKIGPDGLSRFPATGTSIGASGTTSTVAMVACCAHHITDVLPILGLTAAATFLANYRLLFMWVGLGTTLLGISYMVHLIIRERRRAMPLLFDALLAKEL